MQDHKVKRLPAVDVDGRLAGIVSRMDVLSGPVLLPPRLGHP